MGQEKFNSSLKEISKKQWVYSPSCSDYCIITAMVELRGDDSIKKQETVAEEGKQRIND